ncbi:hypothetical protein TWF718_011396 [Orbilia javanica]|uniref:RRM domain-containing protein n=1 Tax=Orbilia javanica TaxID=47235 RepID=A0AAN8MWG7_9PEZI
MPLLETPLDGKYWPSPLTTSDPEHMPQRVDSVIPYPQRAYYFTHAAQPDMSPGIATSQSIPTTIAPPTSGDGHESYTTSDPFPYMPSVVLDTILPTNVPQPNPTLPNVQQPSILNHPATIQFPGARTAAWPMLLQEISIPPNIGHIVEGGNLQTQLVGGVGAYSGPVTFSTAQSSNGSPVAIAGNGSQNIQSSQSMRSAASPHYFTAVGPMISNYPGAIQPNPATASNPNPDYPKVFILQPSLRNNTPNQEFIGLRSSQSTTELKDTDFQVSQTYASLTTATHIPANGYAQTHAWKGSTDDGLSDLNNMTRAWLRSNITSFDDVLQHIPLEELGKQALIIREPSLLPHGRGCSWNLVKIENIPYNLDDDMLFEFLGKIPGLVPQEHGGVHIIMDRTTGKTMDCFLEFPSVGAAERFIQRRCNNNRRCILGGRHISLELVREGELMRWLFPKVRGAAWGDNGDLIFGEWEGLNAPVEIISREELVMILGHARTPHRSPFSRKCLQRPYESLMSVVTKFPWKETDNYTLKQRDLIFQAAFEAGELLKRQILRGKAGPNIDLRLLRRLCRTISFCPGFTYRQKLIFLDAMGITTTECFTILGDLGISHPLATQFQALTVRPGADYVAVEAIANLVADGVSRGNSIRNGSGLGTRYGSEGTELSVENENRELTMRAAATIELETVVAAIKATFAPAGGTEDHSN